MKKMHAFCKALQEATGIPREELQAFAEDSDLALTGRDLGHGVEVGLIKYQLVVHIEDYAGSGLPLLAFTAAWLADNDPERHEQGLKDPDVDIDGNDGRSVDIHIAIDFEEAIEIVPEEEGPITFDGRQWKVIDVPIDVATDLVDLKKGAPEEPDE
ncbi:MAG: phage tail protein [Desulfovibrio sp.]